VAVLQKNSIPSIATIIHKPPCLARVCIPLLGDVDHYPRPQFPVRDVAHGVLIIGRPHGIGHTVAVPQLEFQAVEEVGVVVGGRAVHLLVALHGVRDSFCA